MLLNFFETGNLQFGKQIIDAALVRDETKFIQNFRQVTFEEPDPQDRSAKTRFDRRALVYRALLVKAGFEPPTKMHPSTRGLFSKELLDALKNSGVAGYQSAATTFGIDGPTSGDSIDSI